MNAVAGAAAEWPERIHYVCNSGSGIVVNASPPMQAGRERIAGMTILCATPDWSQPKPEELRESLAPMRRLCQFARERLEIDADAVYGAPDSSGGWIGALDREAKRAAKLDATLVYNVTGGPRSLPIAALLGAPNAVRAQIFAISVSFADRTCRRLVFNAQGELVDEAVLPTRGRIGFGELVPLYGYREQDRAERRKHEAFLTGHSGVADRVLEAALRSWRAAGERSKGRRPGKQWTKPVRDYGRDVVAGLHLKALDAQALGLPFDIEARDLRFRDSRATGPVFKAFEGIEGLEVARDADGRIERLGVRGEEAHRFIGGVWLEAAILNRVRRALRHAPRAEIVAGARLAVEGSRTGGANAPPDDSEIDVAVVIDDQLHVVEAKAVKQSGKIADAVAKLVKIRQELGSQVMRCFLVAPLLNITDMGRGAFVERAEKQGVRLLYGPQAMNFLEREIAALA